MERINIFWFRRDLRLHDNTGIYHALTSGLPVLPVFIFDKDILDKLQNKSDRRVTYIHNHLQKINSELRNYQSSLRTFYAKPKEAFEQLFKSYDVKCVYTNNDYEPYAITRDAEIEALCIKYGVEFKRFKDQVIFEKSEIVKNDESPYTVFTPYSKKWKQKYFESPVESFNTKKHFNNFLKEQFDLTLLKQIGFKENQSCLNSLNAQNDTLVKYHLSRDFPAEDKTTHVSLPLRFGTMSIRQLAKKASELNEKYLNELIWREFFMQVLWHYPQVESRPFRKKFENVEWNQNENEFEKWCKGETGFPIVDAGMRELNETGFMHNRVRMITANFLTKILFMDWRWGEVYFADKLSDYELSSNNGNWQWSAGSGCDAAPYFRIFNPTLQTNKFDSQYKYIKKWIPDFNEKKYLKPIVDFNAERSRSLLKFKKAFA
jgi:deoxyribodipyrimidine photo-lyase